MEIEKDALSCAQHTKWPDERSGRKKNKDGRGSHSYANPSTVGGQARHKLTASQSLKEQEQNKQTHRRVECEQHSTRDVALTQIKETPRLCCE